MANLSQRIVRAAQNKDVQRLVLSKTEILLLAAREEIKVDASTADEADQKSVDTLRDAIANPSIVGDVRKRFESLLEAAEVDLGIRPAPPVKPRAKKEVVAPPAPLVVDPASLATDAVS